jgi:hypothetical protein
MTSPSSSPPTDPWRDLDGACRPEVLRAPGTWGDPARPPGMAPPPNLAGAVRQLRRTVIGRPWADQLVLLTAVLYSRNILHHTVAGSLSTLNAGFAALFPALGLDAIADWDADRHLAAYLDGDVLPADTARHRLSFWLKYAAGSKHLRRWLAGLPPDLQAVYRPYCLPCASDPREMTRRIRAHEVIATQEARRKAETDALMPAFAELRSQAHLRHNLLARIRAAYRQAIATAERDGCALPREFALLEGGDAPQGRPPTERLIFRLWTRRSFVLAHADRFTPGKVHRARYRVAAFRREKDGYLLEFVRAERLDGDGPPTGLWFHELLERNVLGANAVGGTAAERAARQAWLREQGYGGEGEEGEAIHPFSSKLLSWTPAGEHSHFVLDARRRTGVIFIPVESLHLAATFGLVALHILTANGMRINELMQLRAAADCIVPLVLPAPGGAGEPTVHWEARVIPKGQREPRPYYFDDEHLRLLARVKALLGEHYGLDPRQGGELPVVPYRARDDLGHRFPPDRYLFQYAGAGLRQLDIAVCMRLLAHGLVFQTLEGRRVVLRPHLLRHGFATWALNVAREPVDIVGALLHQQNLDVTRYYGKPNARRIIAASQGLLTRIASYIDVAELAVRGPEEVRRLLAEARATHGTLAHTRGGRCLRGGECPILFACVGCPAKAPDPACRGEVAELRDFTLAQRDAARRRGLDLEVLQFDKKLRQCAAELREMDLIEAYREDERREPRIEDGD